MIVDEKKGLKVVFKGKTFYFCSDLCVDLFKKYPSRYTAQEAASTGPGTAEDRSIAYFSMEIAIDPLVPTYSGGLGILAGDTLRSCADLKIPIVALTLLHEKGYFYQELDHDGNQTEKHRLIGSRQVT